MLNLASILEQSALRHSDKAAFVLGGHGLTFGELDAAARKVAGALVSMGVTRGDKVALTCPNLPYFPIVYFGILKAGAAVVPLNVLFKAREVEYHLKDSEAKAYFCFEGTAELAIGKEGAAGFGGADGCDHLVAITADPAAPSPLAGATTLGALLAAGDPTFDTVQTGADDTAVILYTSGTTGQPKGAELSHSNLFMNCLVSRDVLAFEPEDRTLVVLPLFHSFGQVVLMNTGVLCGVTSILSPRFEAEAALALMQEHRISVFAGVPTMYWALLHAEAEGVDLAAIAANMRLAVSGGSALPVQVLREFEERFGVPILEGYGLSETSPVASFNHLDRERKPGSVGTPIWGVEMRIVDDEDNEVPTGEAGEIVIRGHNVMKGYYRRPEANAKALRGGWFHSGDVGIMDEDGYFFIVDRTKDMIIRGGFNVYPREIEEVMMEHPDVSLVAVLGEPHEQHGEEIKAFVVPAEGTEPTEQGLIDWCKERLAAYKYPRSIEFRESLPMTATGKILKTELRS
ncbi:MAG: long-chain fatty acid--CoA ligase [Acidobacteria bacterium]|nr:long-chain fatty acid--CoA ligase [Acidobacteriota bacterium]